MDKNVLADQLADKYINDRPHLSVPEAHEARKAYRAAVLDTITELSQISDSKAPYKTIYVPEVPFAPDQLALHLATDKWPGKYEHQYQKFVPDSVLKNIKAQLSCLESEHALTADTIHSFELKIKGLKQRIKDLKEIIDASFKRECQLKEELDAKRKDGHMLVEHGYRMAAEHEAADLKKENTKLQKALCLSAGQTYTSLVGSEEATQLWKECREALREIVGTSDRYKFDENFNYEEEK